jgi:hypothetical protein
MENAPPTPEEKAAADATRDISQNVTDGKNWKPYDTKYVRERILRAIRSVADDPAIGREIPGFLRHPPANK